MLVPSALLSGAGNYQREISSDSALSHKLSPRAATHFTKWGQCWDISTGLASPEKPPKPWDHRMGKTSKIIHCVQPLSQCHLVTKCHLCRAWCHRAPGWHSGPGLLGICVCWSQMGLKHTLSTHGWDFPWNKRNEAGLWYSSESALGAKHSCPCWRWSVVSISSMLWGSWPSRGNNFIQFHPNHAFGQWNITEVFSEIKQQRFQKFVQNPLLISS